MRKKSSGQDSWDDLEIFTQRGAKISSPRVTIADNSVFHLNAGFIHAAKIAEKTHAVLGYSPEKQCITFQFTSDAKAEGALALVQRTGGASIGTRSFFNFFFIDPKVVAGKYEPKKIKIPRIGDCWAIHLSEKM